VFRRQALDRGAMQIGVDKIVTGHNGDDVAETILMNLLRGDVARLQRCTNIVTVRQAGFEFRIRQIYGIAQFSYVRHSIIK